MNSGKNIPVVSVAGDKNSGKTSLIEQLVSTLKRDGYGIVGVIKYARRDIQIDHEGKDTYRFYESGADAVYIASPAKMAFIRRIESPPPLDEVLGTYFPFADVVFLEGYREGGCPKIHLVAPGKEPGESEQAPADKGSPVLRINVSGQSNPISQEVLHKALEFVRHVMKGTC